MEMMKKVLAICMLMVCLVSFNASAAIVARYSYDVNGADISGNNNHSQLQDGSTIVMDAERGTVLDVQGGAGAYISNSYGTDTWIANLLVQSNTLMMWYKMDSWGSTAWAPWLSVPQMARRNGDCPTPMAHPEPS